MTELDIKLISERDICKTSQTRNESIDSFESNRSCRYPPQEGSTNKNEESSKLGLVSEHNGDLRVVSLENSNESEKKVNAVDDNMNNGYFKISNTTGMHCNGVEPILTLPFQNQPSDGIDLKLGFNVDNVDAQSIASRSDDSESELSTGSSVSFNNKDDDILYNTPKLTSENFSLSKPSKTHHEQYTDEVNQLRKTIERLENERQQLELKASHTVCLSQIDQLQQEIKLFKKEQDLDKRTQATLKMEIESFKKEYEIANRERETIVMRYAVSEMEGINQKKERDIIEKKYKELAKEKENLGLKLKNTIAEKARISQFLDSKCCDLENMSRDVEKLKEELNSKEIKIKWTQNKLKSEIESHKESEARVEDLSNKIHEAKEEAEKAKKDAEIVIKNFLCSQENRAYVLEQQLKELQAQIILEKHTQDEKENSNKMLLYEVESQRNKHMFLMDENNALKLKVACLEKERHEQSEIIGHLRQSVSKSSQEVDTLQEKTLVLENLTQQLQREQERTLVLQSEVAQLRTANEDLVGDIAGCREREAEMLEFTQKVTAKNVRLQSEFSCVEAKARQLECDEEPLQRKINELTKKIESLNKELEKERSDRNEEKKVVARHLAEKTAKVESLTREVEDLKGENQVMRHKHATAIRELNREVAQFRRRLDQPERSSGSESLCLESRASSCTSLPETAPSLPLPRIQMEPDKQTMVDRILRLQKDNVRLREKMDFLEEHSKQLVGELQKKTRVLQSYILREEAGTLTSGSMDLNKAELSKHGGIMASMYKTKPVDDSMTLELSLEINQKLQAVLEDTLLKNITLKENIDTLGDEIRRLSMKC